MLQFLTPSFIHILFSFAEYLILYFPFHLMPHFSCQTDTVDVHYRAGSLAING